MRNAMTQEEFQTLVTKEPDLAGPIRRAATAAAPGTFGPPTELAAIALMFPIVVFVVRGIGLPWLYEAARYSELWRLRFHDWIDGQYQQAGLDADQAEKAGEALRSELESTTEAGARGAWERLAQLLSQDEPHQTG